MSESKQRWRIVFARDDDARFLSHLDAVHLWERAFRRGEIPVATSGGFSPRPRLVFAAPLPLGMLAEQANFRFGPRAGFRSQVRLA